MWDIFFFGFWLLNHQMGRDRKKLAEVVSKREKGRERGGIDGSCEGEDLIFPFRVEFSSSFFM